MKSVFRYQIGELNQDGIFAVQMPVGAKVLLAGEQEARGELSLWALVDSEAPMETRRFQIAGTGHEVKGGEHVASFILHDGFHVFHVFEQT